MKKRNLKLIALGLTGLMGVAALTGCGSSKEKSATVSTNGSTSMEEVMGALSEQYQKDNEGVKVTYDPTGSGTGIEEAKNGNTDIGLASRALKDDEKDGLEQKVVALDGISVIVNAKNGVKDLTTQQVADIFSGKITDWSQVGGKAGKISCIGRESGSGTRDGFEGATGTGRQVQAGTGIDPPVR